jgi:hypothetical protein
VVSIRYFINLEAHLAERIEGARSFGILVSDSPYDLSTHDWQVWQLIRKLWESCNGKDTDGQQQHHDHTSYRHGYVITLARVACIYPDRRKAGLPIDVAPDDRKLHLTKRSPLHGVCSWV